jgi:alkylation response protein AidB-like acyl-CoA dehydrogenase
MIDFSFTPQEQLLREQIIDFSKANFNAGIQERDRLELFDRSLWSRAGELSLQGLTIPTEFGGLGLGIISTVSALEALGYGCEDNGLSFAIGAHLLACVIPIWLYGSDDQKEEYLAKLSNGTWIAANAITEEAGSNVFEMNATAFEKDGGYTIEGKKKFISNAPVADVALTYLSTDKTKKLGGTSCFLLKREDFQSSEPIKKMGLRSCLMGDIELNNAVIGSDRMLGKPGAGLMIFNKSMIWERIGLSAIHLGTLQRLLENTLSFLKGRERSGNSLSKYQAITHQLANIKAQLTGARWATYFAAWCLENKENADLYASVSKLQTSELYKSSCMTLLQVHGAIGYTDEHEMERNLRDATSSTLYSGSSEIQRNLIFGGLNSL